MTDSTIELPPGHAAVVTMDQRASRRSPDRVDEALLALNHRYADCLVRPFVRTAGDEVQAVSVTLDWLVDLVLANAREERWWIGIGIGAIEPLGETARDSRGDAFYAAREAVAIAKRRPWGFAIIGPAAVDAAERCLQLLSFIVRHRTDRQHAVAELFRQHRHARTVAAELGVRPSTVSESLRRAGVVEEISGRELAQRLLTLVTR